MPCRIVRPVWSPLLPSPGTGADVVDIGGSRLDDLRVVSSKGQYDTQGWHFDGHQWHEVFRDARRRVIMSAGRGPLPDFLVRIDDRFFLRDRLMSVPDLRGARRIGCAAHSVVGGLVEDEQRVLVFTGEKTLDLHIPHLQSNAKAAAVFPGGGIATSDGRRVCAELESRAGDVAARRVGEVELDMDCEGLAADTRSADWSEVYAFGGDGQLRVIRCSPNAPPVCTPVLTGTRRTLRAGVVLVDGSLLVVGDAGLSLRVERCALGPAVPGYKCEIEEPAPGKGDLLTVHLLDDGTVVAAGSGGEVFVRRALVLRPAPGPVQGVAKMSAVDLVAGVMCIPLTAPVTLADSEDDPPARKAGCEQDRPEGRNNADFPIIPIDELLGTYEASRQLITLYMKEIRKAARQLGLDTALLARIVELHEAGHALVHLGASADGETFDPAAYRAAGPEFHEPLAQVIALTGARALGPDHERAFWKLGKCQPPVYRLPVHLQNLTREEVRALVLESRARAMRVP